MYKSVATIQYDDLPKRITQEHNLSQINRSQEQNLSQINPKRIIDIRLKQKWMNKGKINLQIPAFHRSFRHSEEGKPCLHVAPARGQP